MQEEHTADSAQRFKIVSAKLQKFFDVFWPQIHLPRNSGQTGSQRVGWAEVSLPARSSIEGFVKGARTPLVLATLEIMSGSTLTRTPIAGGGLVLTSGGPEHGLVIPCLCVLHLEEGSRGATSNRFRSRNPNHAIPAQHRRYALPPPVNIGSLRGIPFLVG
ncbi:hypothetical protein GOODEAATRI_018835 [Goodea atripinnis]|uniref:Uncharacterized protein n=1 Tax=Goodea atripinnis TaxID=208336 RepID=A0ABV0NBR0_9TELE